MKKNTLRKYDKNRLKEITQSGKRQEVRGVPDAAVAVTGKEGRQTSRYGNHIKREGEVREKHNACNGT